MVDLGSLVLLMSIFGWKVAVLYVILGLVIAVIGGTLIEKLHLENQVEEYIRNGQDVYKRQCIDDADIILKPDNQSGNFGDIDVSKVECAIQGKVLLE